MGMQVFSKVGPIDRVHMGLNQQTRRPCGFAFVVYHSHKVAEAACSYISGTKVDNRYIRVDMDWGFEEGRQYGRGKSGGQVRGRHKSLRLPSSVLRLSWGRLRRFETSFGNPLIPVEQMP
jgi:RNA recognition motif-containing protein